MCRFKTIDYPEFEQIILEKKIEKDAICCYVIPYATGILQYIYHNSK